MAITCDYLVIGSGVAGLTFALEASAHGDIILVTKRSRDESNTKYAQGGLPPSSTRATPSRRTSGTRSSRGPASATSGRSRFA